MLRLFDWKRDVDRDDLGTPPLCYEINGVSTGLIGVVWNKDLIAWLELQGTEYRVDTGGGVLNQSEVVSITRKERSEFLSGGLEDTRHQVLKESNRFVFHEVLPPSLFFANRRWSRSKGAMVQENPVLLQSPKTGKSASRRQLHIG
jgi:hypothetical protein